IHLFLGERLVAILGEGLQRAAELAPAAILAGVGLRRHQHAAFGMHAAFADAAERVEIAEDDLRCLAVHGIDGLATVVAIRTAHDVHVAQMTASIHPAHAARVHRAVLEAALPALPARKSKACKGEGAAASASNNANSHEC